MTTADDILRRVLDWFDDKDMNAISHADALKPLLADIRAHLTRVEGERGVRLPTAIKEDMIAHPDGDYVYWPTGGSGCYDARLLRAIASKLDELNAPTERSSEEK